MAHLSVVASPFAILPSPPSRFCPLAPYCTFSWHLTAKTPPWLAPYCYSPAGTLLLLLYLPLRSVDPSSVTPSRGIALPLWLLSNALDRCNDLGNRVSGYSGPTVSVFSLVDDHSFTPLRPAFPVLVQSWFLSFCGACRRVWVSLLYISMNCLLTCLGYIILGARWGGFFLWIRGV